MADVILSRAALRDLDRIVHRIAIEDPDAARRFRDRILTRIDLLRDLPESANPRPEFGAGIRTLPIGRYIVFLRVKMPKVIVLRIIHGARDLPRIMKPRSNP
jgi:toxin ParE1/3/4